MLNLLSPDEFLVVMAALFFLMIFGAIGVAVVVYKWKDFWND